MATRSVSGQMDAIEAMKGMRVSRLVVALLLVLSCFCASAAPACPRVQDLKTVLVRSGFSGAPDADLKVMGSDATYCFVRYRYVFGSAQRMSSRLVIFRHGEYIGSYSIGFTSIAVSRDGVVLKLIFGGQASIPFGDIGRDLLIDGEVKLFYK